jgi:hypothetical protein
MTSQTLENSEDTESRRVGTLADRELVAELMYPTSEESAFNCFRCENCARTVWVCLCGAEIVPGTTRTEDLVPLRREGGRLSLVSSGWSAASQCSTVGSPSLKAPPTPTAGHRVPSCDPVLDVKYAASNGPVLGDDGKTVFCSMDCYWSASLDPNCQRIRLVYERKGARPKILERRCGKPGGTLEAGAPCRPTRGRPPTDERGAPAALLHRRSDAIECNAGASSPQLPPPSSSSSSPRVDVSKRLLQKQAQLLRIPQSTRTAEENDASLWDRLRCGNQCHQSGDVQHAMYEHHAYFGGTFRRTVGVEVLRRYAWC